MSLLLLFNSGLPYVAGGDVQARTIGLYRGAGDLIAQLRNRSSFAYRALGDVQARGQVYTRFEGDVATWVKARLRAFGDFSGNIGFAVRRSGDYAMRLASTVHYSKGGDVTGIIGTIYRTGGDVKANVQIRSVVSGAVPYTAFGDIGDGLALWTPFTGDYVSISGTVYRKSADLNGVLAVGHHFQADLSGKMGNYRTFGDFGDTES